MTQQWKPIASAPKDGTEIIVFHPEAGVCAAFCPADGFAWHVMDGMNTVVGSKSGKSIPVMTSFLKPPTHWMPLPSAPCLTCNGHGMVGGLAPHSGYNAEPCPDCTPPAGAQDDAKDDSITLDKLADYIADNWPDKKYSLEEICQRLNATWPTAFMPAGSAGDTRKPDFARADQFIQDYVAGYEMCGEDQEGRDASHTPTEGERALIVDAIHGLMAQPEFIAALSASQQQEG
ncbi:hypothetical protein [Achromobacter sp. ACRQX]|uniref:hypothetical protein n=1 Tax=Achromobacter sp. ACRQX TaxID=2918181 RepID=UPI001EF2556E|nr:hypothetical protein [Achromobacter sp. ACRQX]MCG7324319.1 hypothetical protein [Achromobacter sp. ACRQX]